MKTKITIQNHKSEKAGKLKMYFKFYIIDNLEYLEVWEDGECVNTLTQPFCENVLKLVNDDGMLSRSALGLYARNTFLYWAGEQELDDRALYTAIPSLHVAMENRQGDLIEVLCPEHFSEILFYEIIKANRKIADKRLWIIRCKRCNRIFANHKQGRSVFYCNYKDNNGYSCHDIVLGSFEGWNKSEEEKRIQRTFIRYYNAQRRKLQNQKISRNQLSVWSKNARAVRDQCKKGEITEEDFVKWLDENKDNYTEP